ncbi:MAG: LacI family DNA-binding transcriptional regulator [Anaerolineae bacterium]
MPTKRVTSRQVAKKAGVSQTTVSFVLNNHAAENNIPNETIERVQQAARELGYVPDAAARTLARGRSNNIGLMLAQPHDQVFIDEYIPNIITGLSRITKEHGYRILLEMVHDDLHADAYANLMRSKEVAGIIVNQPFHNDAQRLLALQQEGFAIVTLANIHPTIPSVMVDKLLGVRKAVKHLIKLGHERIGCITYAPIASNEHVRQRLMIFQRALESKGLVFDDGLVREGAFDPDTGYEAMKSLLNQSPLPTAVFAMNDMMAYGAMTAIQEAGLRIPEDVALVGFDDVRLARFTTPALTTIYEPDIEHGYRAGELLIRLINEEPIEQPHIVLGTQLKIRDSCGWKLANPDITPPIS